MKVIFQTSIGAVAGTSPMCKYACGRIRKMKAKNKLLTILAVFLCVLLLTGIGAFKHKPAGIPSGNTSVSGKTRLKLGGIQSRMPENSALVFFGSTLGQTLSKYTAYKNMDEALYALRTGEVDAVWTCDVTADYLLETDQDLELLDYEAMSDIQKTDEARFEFGMALKDSETSKKLRDSINLVFSDMKQDGSLEKLTYSYIENAAAQDLLPEEARKYPNSMKSVSGNGVIKVGITGAVSPIELIDTEGEPYGFCVALMDEIGTRLSKRIEFTVLDNETAFTSLMSGKVDLIFAYATGRTTTEYKQNYIMTDGYYKMQRYEFLKLKAEKSQN